MVDNTIVLQLNAYVRPEIKESPSNEWVLNGDNNDFYQYIIDRYNGSPTNSAVIDSYTRMTYGLGLNVDTPLFNKKEVRRIVKDFNMFGEASFELLYLKGKPVSAIHIPKEKIAPEKADENGNITGYWYCYNWNKKNEFPPKRFDAFKYGKGAKRSEIVVIKDYQVGQFYFSNPSYFSAMPYAELEEEIANFFINHVKNKFMVSTIVNVNNGIPESEEERRKLARQYQNGTSGTSNAGVIVVSFNDNKDNATTIEQVQVVDAYQQYQYLGEEARRQICVGHKVVSTSIIGIDKSTGFSSNADEIETAFNETMLNVIQPIQENLLDVFQEIANMSGIKETLEFVNLRQPKVDEAQKADAALTPDEQAISDAKISYNGAQIASAIDIFAKVKEGILTTEQAIVFLVQFLNIEANVAQTLFTSGTTPIQQLAKISLSQVVTPIADPLIELGEIIDESEWECIDEVPVSGEPILTETSLHLAKTFSSFPNVKSEQDNDLFKIRYSYSGPKADDKTRDFCRKMLSADKVYRKEDIELASSKVVNPGFGPKGADTYNIWLYKGSVNCRHFFMRKIYLRRNNKNISVNEARKMILQLDPKDRQKAKWEENDPLVAQPAQSSNNYFRLPKE